MDSLCLTESMQTYWLHKLDEYWYVEDKPYLYDFGVWPEWLFKYYNEINLSESIQSFISCRSQNNID